MNCSTEHNMTKHPIKQNSETKITPQHNHIRIATKLETP